LTSKGEGITISSTFPPAAPPFFPPAASFFSYFFETFSTFASLFSSFPAVNFSASTFVLKFFEKAFYFPSGVKIQSKVFTPFNS
jgi:hypothetical protein